MPHYTDKNETQRSRWRSRLPAGIFAIVAISLCAPACVVRARGEEAVVYGHPAVYVDTAPPDVYVYPRQEYRGGYAYLVDGRWYYETPRGWVIFRDTPRELEARRVYTVRGTHHHAPPARVYEERRVPAYTAPRAPVERGRRYYPQ